MSLTQYLHDNRGIISWLIEHLRLIIKISVGLTMTPKSVFDKLPRAMEQATVIHCPPLAGMYIYNIW